MARKPRLYVEGVPQHVIQRGNNRQVCFNSDQDLVAYAHWLWEAKEKFGLLIHAWVFMTNHVHLLVTPENEKSVPGALQYLGRLYVRYYNREYGRSGTLWEGRYKSCLVQSETYVLQCSRYIELNPVRAQVVDDPADYRWSSYRCNAFGQYSKLYSAHPEYLKLGQAELSRQETYRELFRAHVDNDLLAEIRRSVNQGLVLGDGRFKEQVESNLKRRVRPGKVGRPRKKSEGECDRKQTKMLL